MSDNVTITFTADISDLQRGMQQAATSVDATTGALRGGAAQVGVTFSSLSQAYAQGATQAAQATRDASATQLAIAREQANAQYQVALDGVKMQEALVKEQTQTSQISQQQQLQSLLALEDQRAALERQHLQSVEASYAEESSGYLRAQQRLEEADAESARRREQIELTYNREIYADYRRTFDEVGSAVSSSIMGMIEGHESLRQAAQRVLLAIIQDFIQARIRTVADWLAGVATETTGVQIGQTAQTAAVATGVAARTSAQQAGASAGLAANASSMISQILASARETFAGVFGFLAPILGPAAIGPAAAAEGTVAAAASFAVGSWELPSDMLANVHRGEMIVPAGATPWAQSVLAGAASGGASGVTVNHATHFNVSALDSQDVSRWFKNNSKMMLRTINEAVRHGSHLGLDKLRGQGMNGFVNGVNLLPSTGEFTYDTLPYLGQRTTETLPTSINRYANGGPAAGAGSTTDYSIALDNLQAEIPCCTTVALVVAWFGNSTDVSACKIYPSTTYINGSFQQASGGADQWRCSGLSQLSPGLIPIPQNGDSFIYGGTPSDQSIVRCIRDLKTRGLRVVFYPFILMTDSGESWRGEIAFQGSDVSSAATAAVDAFLGSAAASQFTPDTTNLTVGYSGPPTDFTYRRMILHYANLCVVAGGIDLFLLGSELRGIERVRGPAWTKGGTTGGDGKVTWDYQFVAGLMQLSDDVRGVFDAAGLTKNLSGLHNLISYSADWSVWMGFQHPGESGQWPHLDQLYGHSNIDLVAFDNYLPLSDFTTGNAGLDVLNWSAPAPDPNAWPPPTSTMSGLGLSGQPTIYSKNYLKANIEGGEKFNWFYSDSNNDGIGLDPNGSDLRVSLPEGDRLAQSRSPYFPNQQLLANKQLRWWWNNPHQAIYDDGDGNGFAPHGPFTEWVPQSKSIIFAEYGFAAVDRATNQPNVFFGANSSLSATPFWSIWDPTEGGGFQPRQDDEIQLLALQALYEYWFVDGHNANSSAGLPMIEPAFCSVWNWDARPFPTFPARSDVWGDAGNWQAGQWLNGKGPFLIPPVPDPPPTPGLLPAFPPLNGQGLSVHYRPDFSTGVAQHASGRESRTSKMSVPFVEIELTFDLLSMDDATRDFETLAGFFAEMQGRGDAFTFPVPVELGLGATFNCRFEDDSEDIEEFMARLWTLQSLKLRMVK